MFSRTMKTPLQGRLNEETHRIFTFSGSLFQTAIFDGVFCVQTSASDNA